MGIERSTELELEVVAHNGSDVLYNLYRETALQPPPHLIGVFPDVYNTKTFRLKLRNAFVYSVGLPGYTIA